MVLKRRRATIPACACCYAPPYGEDSMCFTRTILAWVLPDAHLHERARRGCRVLRHVRKNNNKPMDVTT